MTVLGIGDSSEYDTWASTDWKKAASMGCKFGVVRASTTGAWVAGKPGIREDLRHLANVNAMNDAGMEHLSYCWFDPRPSVDVVAQAEMYIQAVDKVGGPGEYAIFDMENSGTVITYGTASVARAKVWCDIVSQRWPVAIYSYPSFVDQLATISDIAWMRNYKWMCAHWDVSAPRDPYPWYPGAHVIWQYTANAIGSRYGFNAVGLGKPTPRICLAVKNDVT
jgi:hypothetical protein